MSLPPGCVRECPGCSHREKTRSESEAQKRDWLLRALAPWGDRIEALRGASDSQRWGYREKTTLRSEWDPTIKRWKLGLLKDETVVDIPHCPVHSPRTRAMLEVLAHSLPGPEVLSLAFVSIAGPLVTLVVKAPFIETGLIRDFSGSLAEKLKQAGATALWINFNPAAGNRVFSNRGWVFLWGAPLATFKGGLPGETFAYGPQSFQQLLPDLFFEALGEAERFLAVQPEDRVVDLYSGVGVSLRRWKSLGAQTIGVELGGEAVECALANAGAPVLRGRASERIPQIIEWLGSTSGPLVFANPPRLGLELEILQSLTKKIRPRRMAYLSCSAGTLARDLSAFCEAGYAVARIIPYDFFPQTPHVETLALLETLSASEPN